MARQSYSNFQKNLNRERVIEFESEMQGKVSALANLERDMQDISEKRKHWLRNITRTDDTGHDIFLAKLGLIQAQAQLSSLEMTLDVARLEGHYEAQTLNYLVAATQPLEDGETEDMRNLALMKCTRQDSDVLSNFLEQSLNHRIKLGNKNYDLQSQLNLLIHEIGFQQIAEEEDFREKLNYYSSRMNTSLVRSKKQYKKLTEEYLILRHNARVAKEVLVRGQNDATQARKELQQCLDTIVEEAQSQREKMERNATSELKYLTEDLRAEVIKKEREVESRSVLVKHLVQHQKKEVSTLRKECNAFTKRYNKLQNTRRAELGVVQVELKNLRDKIAEMEDQLATVGVDPELHPIDIATTLDEQGELFLQFKARLKELDKENRRTVNSRG
mmetsp:Transcript_8470/g.14052  ORF Transcript_8470/g.14052 Transcript_8470/m.14052 type:complete len:388 (-) Transcript_8470:18-1181(-)|eukprot:CAMPEP_0174955068 /NCGR_PEP_ID=MMETSP0004_2-20121128/782_1 /TAXON_ID=420556 /ORGANISM="Ochromonas sp., Strain CCMP1393" /LENGTH=387 /DNA_ID=CAMNT_0016202967 /DNA_START=198 /DNA_END=1361 /DNA_ORIENTATION=+